MSILNITNGDSAVALLRDAGIEGEIVPWRDVLHDGPVPADLSLSELSKVRARFIADQNWGEFEEILDGFVERDNFLMSAAQYDQVILWFEHDLYDQLQLIQILDWFSKQVHPNLSLICTDHYLGLCEPKDVSALSSQIQKVTQEQLQIASNAWTAFRSPSPTALVDLLQFDLSSLPYLEDSIYRLLDEYPDSISGLSRTAFQILQLLSEKSLEPGKLFSQNQTCEERVFLGDWSFWIIAQDLLECSPALITSNLDTGFPPQTANKDWLKQILAISEAGKAILNGELHFLECAPQNRWLGGVELKKDNYWCWDSTLNQFHIYT